MCHGHDGTRAKISASLEKVHLRNVCTSVRFVLKVLKDS